MFSLPRKRCVTAMLSITILFAGCQNLPETSDDEEIAEPTTINYLIKKGEHYSSNNAFSMLKVQKLRFEVLFDSTAIYTSTIPENQYDINKLYGLSDCGQHHQVSSARFGWRWLNKRLELHAYTYVGSARKSVFITSITLGKPTICALSLADGEYEFEVEGVKVTLPRACNGSTEAYQLYPYFGGDEVAPHDITIKIKPL